MLQATVSFKGDVFKELECAKEEVASDITSVLITVGNAAVDESPVWSGAYVRSFAWSANGARKRRSYKSRQDRVDEGAAKATAKDQLYADLAVIEQIDLEDLKSVMLTNGAQHASLVEAGTPSQPGGGIFARVRDRLSTIGTVRRGRT